MDWQEISVKTENQAVEAISDLFYQLGSGGVVINDPELLRKMANSGTWDAYELPEESLTQTDVIVSGFFPCDQELVGKVEALKAGIAIIFARLAMKPGDISITLVQEEDWGNAWKAFFHPVKISNSLVIRPSWVDYQPRNGELVIDLDPGMAFGTGYHVTTVMCAEHLEEFLKPGMTVLDVGTGTGILAMSAAKLGAGEILAMDFDSVAVRVARDNIQSNGLEDRIIVRQNDLLSGITAKVDLILANIIADVIIKLFPQAKSHLVPGGLILVSGIIGERKDEVARGALNQGFILVKEQEREDWVAQVWKLKEC